MSIPYTGKTVRLCPPTEPLSIPVEAARDPAIDWIVMVTIIALALILGGCWLVVRVNDQAFAVLAAFLVAGFIWIAFGRQG